MRGTRWAIAFAIAWTAAATARAHDLVCSETVDGGAEVAVDHYPATVHVAVTITNVHPTLASIARSIDAGLLAGRGFSFTPATPFPLDVGASATTNFDLVLSSQADCLALANADGFSDANFDSRILVTFDSGSAQCTARVVCEPDACEAADGGTDGGVSE